MRDCCSGQIRPTLKDPLNIVAPGIDAAVGKELDVASKRVVADVLLKVDFLGWTHSGILAGAQKKTAAGKRQRNASALCLPLQRRAGPR